MRSPDLENYGLGPRSTGGAREGEWEHRNKRSKTRERAQRGEKKGAPRGSTVAVVATAVGVNAVATVTRSCRGNRQACFIADKRIRCRSLQSVRAEALKRVWLRFNAASCYLHKKNADAHWAQERVLAHATLSALRHTVSWFSVPYK